MAATVGSLNVNATLQTASFDKSLSTMQGKLKGLQNSYAQVGAKMTSIGKTLSVGITAPFVAFAAKGISEARETAAAMAQVNAALASMGPVAGRTAAQLEKAANAFEGSSLYEGDAILKDVTANLLTFGNISGQAFDQAQQAAINLATRMDGDLKGAALLVGKALNDPIKGMGALGKAGIQFSTDQKAAIKAFTDTGNAAGAQAIILGEFQKQFGGAAAAAQNADPFNKLSDAFNSMAESLGTILLPILTRAAEFLAGLATKFQTLSPETQKWVVIVGSIAAVAGPVLIILGSMVTAIGALAPLVTALSAAWGALKVVFLATRVAALATLPALLPFIVPLGAIALAVGAVYLAFKNWDKIKAFVVSTYNTIKTYMVDKLNAVWASVKAKVEQVTGFFKTMWDKVVGHSYIPDMVTAIGAEMAKLDALMVAPVKAATSKAAEAFRELQGRVAGVLDRLFPKEAMQNQFVKELADLEAYAKKAGWGVDQLAEAVRRLRAEYADKTAPVVTTTPATSDTPDPDAPQTPNAWIGLLDQITPALQRIGDLGGGAFAKISDAIVSNVIPAIKAMLDKTQEAGAAMQAIGTAVTGIFQKIFGRKAGGIIGSIAQVGLSLLGANRGGGTGSGGLYNGVGGGLIPGLAKGGAFQIGGLGGIDKNMLSINNKPMARVSRGEMVDIRQPGNDVGRGSIVINQTFAPNLAGNAVDRAEMVRWMSLTKADTMATMRDAQSRRSR